MKIPQQANKIFLLLILTLLVISPVNFAAGRKRSSAPPKKSKASKSSRPKGRNESRSRSRSAKNQRESRVNLAQVRDLMKRQGRRGAKLSKSEKKLLASYYAEQRRIAAARAAAIRAARLRAIRARDNALKNIAAANVLKDNTTGEDLEIRQASIEALGGKAGTVVVMDATNGRIYSIVNQAMGVGSPVKPCSTIKMVVGLAALQEKVFDPDLVVPASSSGINLTDALAKSNNPFFQEMGRRLGYEKVIYYAGNYGFGEKTGANYLGESEGFLPEEGEENTGHMSSHGDGFGFTAIQLAAFTGAIANGGNLYVPRVPRTPDEAENFKPELKRKIEMGEEERARLLTGMAGAVTYGTAKLAYDPQGPVAGKTGTCTGSSAKLGLFTSFSSVHQPKLVVTVITTGSGEAGKRAAEIAGKIYRSISHRMLRDSVSAPTAATIEVQPPALKNQE